MSSFHVFEWLFILQSLWGLIELIFHSGLILDSTFHGVFLIKLIFSMQNFIFVWRLHICLIVEKLDCNSVLSSSKLEILVFQENCFCSCDYNCLIHRLCHIRLLLEWMTDCCWLLEIWWRHSKISGLIFFELIQLFWAKWMTVYRCNITYFS